MPKLIEGIPGVDGSVEFPDDMDDRDIKTFIETNILKTRPKLRDANLVPEALGGVPSRKTVSVQAVGGVPGIAPVRVSVPRSANISESPLSDAAADYYKSVAAEFATGAKGLVAPTKDISRARGLSKMVRAGGKAIAPVALPYALGAAPLALAGGMVVGTLAQEGTERGLKALGVEEGKAELAGDVAGTVVGVPAIKATAKSAKGFFTKPKSLVEALDPDAANKAKVQDVVKWMHEGKPDEVSPAKEAAEAFGIVDKDPNSLAKESAETFAAKSLVPDPQPVSVPAKQVRAGVTPAKSAEESAAVFGKVEPSPAEKSAAAFFPGDDIPGAAMNRDRRRAGVIPPETGLPEPAARFKAQLSDLSKSFFDQDFESLPAEDAALVTKMAEEGLGSSVPEPKINLSDYQSFGGTGAITAMIAKLKQPGAKKLMNFNKLDVSPSEQRLLQQEIARAALKNKIDPFAVEPMEVVVAEAKKLGLPQAQNIVQHMKDMGVKNRAAVMAMRQQINGLTKKVIDTERLLASGTLDNAGTDSAQKTLAMAERDLRNMTDTFTGVSTEYGRGLNAFKLESDNTWDVSYWLGKAKRMGGGYLDDGSARKIREIIVDGEGLTGAAKEKAKQELAKLVGEKFKRGVTDTLSDLVRAGWLSSPKVHAANITANTLMAGTERAAKVISTVPDFVMGKLTNYRTVTPGSFAASVKAVASAKKNPLRYEALTASADKFENRVYGSGNKVDDVVRNWLTGPVFKLLGKEDMMFKKMAFETSLNEQAQLTAMNEYRAGIAGGKKLSKDFVSARAKELYSSPTSTMNAEAVAAAEFATFNNENMVSQAFKSAEGGLRNFGKKHDQEGLANWLMFGAKTMHLPFVRTPTNVVARGLDYTLFAPAKFTANLGSTVAKTIQYRFGKDKIAGETLGMSAARALTPARQKAIAESFGRGTIGTGLLSLGYFMAMEGKGIPLTTKDPNEIGLAKMRGASPGSVLVDGKWRKLDAISPFGTIIGIGMDLYKQNVEKVGDVAAGKPDAFAKQVFGHMDPSHPLDSAGNVLKTSAAIALPNVMELPMLQGVKDVTKAAEGNEYSTNRYLANKAAAFVPYSGLMGELAAVLDPKLRETAGDSPSDSIVRGIQSRIPGPAREALPPAIDRLGREVPTSPMDPLRSMPEKKDPVTVELNRIKVGGTTMPFRAEESLDHFENRVVEMGAPPKDSNETEEEFVKRIEAAGVSRGKFSRDEHFLIEHLAEYEIGRVLDTVVQAPEYIAAPDIEKKKEVRGIISQVRREINAATSGQDYQSLTKEQRLGKLTELLKERGLR